MFAGIIYSGSQKNRRGKEKVEGKGKEKKRAKGEKEGKRRKLSNGYRKARPTM